MSELIAAVVEESHRDWCEEHHAFAIGLFAIGRFDGGDPGFLRVAIGCEGVPPGALVSKSQPAEEHLRKRAEADQLALLDVWELPTLDLDVAQNIAIGAHDVAKRFGARYLGPARIDHERTRCAEKDSGLKHSFVGKLTAGASDPWLALCIERGTRCLLLLHAQFVLFEAGEKPGKGRDALRAALKKAQDTRGLVVRQASKVDGDKGSDSKPSPEAAAELDAAAQLVLTELANSPEGATAKALTSRGAVKRLSEELGAQRSHLVDVALSGLLAKGLVTVAAGGYYHHAKPATAAPAVDLGSGVAFTPVPWADALLAQISPDYGQTAQTLETASEVAELARWHNVSPTEFVDAGLKTLLLQGKVVEEDGLYREACG